MLTTRLLILGAVRIFQPVHGYLVRRELLSWHAEDWAHLNPGSVYNALRTLAKEGYLEEVATEAHGGRPARTSYRLTSEGNTEFMQLLRTALWKIDLYEPAALLAAWSFTWVLSREEVIAAIEHRLEQIEASSQSTRFALETIASGTTVPPPVAEHVRLTQARLEGEAIWDREVLQRLRAGEYWYDGEPDRPWWSSPPSES